MHRKCLYPMHFIADPLYSVLTCGTQTTVGCMTGCGVCRIFGHSKSLYIHSGFKFKIKCVIKLRSLLQCSLQLDHNFTLALILNTAVTLCCVVCVCVCVLSCYTIPVNHAELLTVDECLSCVSVLLTACTKPFALT